MENSDFGFGKKMLSANVIYCVVCTLGNTAEN